MDAVNASKHFKRGNESDSSDTNTLLLTPVFIRPNATSVVYKSPLEANITAFYAAHMARQTAAPRRPKKRNILAAAAVAGLAGWAGSMLYQGNQRSTNDRRLADMAAKLTEQTGVLTKIMGEQASVLNVSIRASQSHVQAIDQLSNITHLFLVPELAQSAEFDSAVRQIHLALASAQIEVRRFTAAWHLARTEHILSPYFLDPLRLTVVLKELATNMPAGLSLPVETLTPDTAHFYYAAIRVFPLIHNDVATLMIHVPLLFKERKLTIYEGLRWPHVTAGDPEVFTYFAPETKYIATNDARTFHVLLGEDDMKQCPM